MLDRLSAVLHEEVPRRAAVVEEVSGPTPPPEEERLSPAEETFRSVQAEPARFGRLHLGVVAALVLLGLVCTGWAVLRARPVALATSVPVTPSVPVTAAPGGAAPTSTGPPAAPAQSPATATPTILVHVLGAVRRPGVVTLPDRARVQDAIEEAGGLRDGADAGELNLAQVLQDGQQLLIGTRRNPAGRVRDGSGPTADATPSAGGRSATSGAGVTVDLNSATETQLDALPGVGPVTAGRILAWRTEHGRFTRVEELQEVDGIGPKTYAQIAPHVRV